MNLKEFFKKNVIHLAVLASFFITMFVYFSLQFDGYGLKQHDIAMYKGMSNEIAHYREIHGEEPLWTNSMFGGMPATQISVEHRGNIFRNMTRFVVRNLPSPSGIFLLHLICFYILGMCLRIKPLIAALGAFAFAFASYEIVILQAGHNSKALAVAFAPPVIGAFVLAYRRNWKWGAILSMIFMGFELAQNHLQVTYYLGFILAGLGIYELVCLIRKKEDSSSLVDEKGIKPSNKFKKFGITTGALFAAYALALFVNYGNIKMTNDYAKHTIRGKNEVNIKPDGSKNEKASDGLERDYITDWSYGKGESFTLLSPYVKGSHSGQLILTNFNSWVEDGDYDEEFKAEILNARYPLYYGEQRMTSGPVYLGVVVVFLAFLGIVLLKSPIKWVYLAVSVLALLLSWGKNFMGLTDFFIDYVPYYDKFRTVTIILVLLEMCIPIIGVLILQQFWDHRSELKEKSKSFLIAGGAFILILILLRVVGINDSYASTAETKAMAELPTAEDYAQDVRDQIASMPKEQLLSNGIDPDNAAQVEQVVQGEVKKFNDQIEGSKNEFAAIKTFRHDMEKSSWNRSILFALAAMGIVALFFFTSLPSPAIVGALIVLVLMDLIPVDKNYLGEVKDQEEEYIHWEAVGNTLYPHEINLADADIMKMELAGNKDLEAKVAKGETKGREIAEATDYEEDTKQRIIDSYRYQALNAATNYRVFDYSGGFNDARTSYFHKSLGGYHGAKLRNFQNVVEFQIAQQNEAIFDMMNVKYILTSKETQDKDGKKVEVPVAYPRESALGNAWLVKSVKRYPDATQELLHLGSKMKVENLGPGKILMNKQEFKGREIHLGQEPVYLMPNGDSLKMKFNWRIARSLKAFFVSDKNGSADYMREEELNMDSLNSFTKLVLLERSYDFNPSTEAVMMESEAKKLSQAEYTGEGEVRMTSYAPNKLEYEADIKGKQLVVFSEVYYNDGWKAFVDGKEQEILKVDYLLRGLELKNGKYKIVFQYEDPAFARSNTMAYLGSSLILLILAGMLFMEWRSGRLNFSKKETITE